MILKSIHLENFMCYRNTQVDFPTSKITNVYGIDIDRNTSNGIGKLALKEAILFALFGKTKINLGELVRKGATTPSKVQLTFELNNQTFIVSRTYHKTSTLEITVNGKAVRFSGVRQKQHYLEEVLGMNYETCVNFSIFDAIRFEDLSSLSSAEIKRLMQLLFNYQKFEQISINLKDAIRTNETLLNQLHHRSVHYYSTKRVNMLTTAQNDLQKQLNGAQKKIEALHDLKQKLGGQLATSQMIINKNTNRINWILAHNNCPTCKQPLNQKFKVLNECQQEVNEHKKVVQSSTVRLQRAERYLKQASQTIDYASQQLIRMHNLLNKLELAKQQTHNINQIEKAYNQNKISLNMLRKFEMFILEHYVQYLEQIVNEYLAKLTDITCKISFLKQGTLMTRSIDKFYMKLYRNYQEYSYMALSSGERMLVAYAFKLAINTLNFRDTFLFVDEGLNKLDTTNRQKLLKMLQESPFNQVFLISHDDTFEGVPIMHIEKKHNESTIKIL
jgi:exonuclease SbcC